MDIKVRRVVRPGRRAQPAVLAVNEEQRVQRLQVNILLRDGIGQEKSDATVAEAVGERHAVPIHQGKIGIEEAGPHPEAAGVVADDPGVLDQGQEDQLPGGPGRRGVDRRVAGQGVEHLRLVIPADADAAPGQAVPALESAHLDRVPVLEAVAGGAESLEGRLTAQFGQHILGVIRGAALADAGLGTGVGESLAGGIHDPGEFARTEVHLRLVVDGPPVDLRQVAAHFGAVLAPLDQVGHHGQAAGLGAPDHVAPAAADRFRVGKGRVGQVFGQLGRPEAGHILQAQRGRQSVDLVRRIPDPAVRGRINRGRRSSPAGLAV
ncbi:MAG: hypothetical protein BWY73_01257 [candidate division TA06 bacterium ADurb.Bin417]|uniref:Uncharacterized protein n=1 Tax=candidate division TA06 bacterium ADurb.Bin417 TaxID=1852828 RepID=A0A1V5MBY7_UNCT6|nr:MAG: hypothetical protein BWY73_01257 [candidate division TA06 bacterium ADurb.Bin417]